MIAVGPLASAEKAIRFADAEVLANEPMAPKTSIRIGGSADLLVRPRSLQGLTQILGQVREHQLELTVIGGGANTLIGDGGIRGVTVKIPAELFSEQIKLDSSSGEITLGAGAPIARLIQLMKSNGLMGAEFLAGIPGTIGGALAMNAGTKMGECISVVEAVELATADGVGWLSRSELSHEYRSTHLPKHAVVTKVRFHLPVGDRRLSQEKMDADLGYRRQTQPLHQPSFGSVFQNPPGDYAGRLIEAVGLKGHLIGRTQISSLHANWIVNLGGGKASEVMALIRLAQERVKAQTGLELKPEVKRVGVFL